jgi:hypothetical protein
MPVYNILQEETTYALGRGYEKTNGGKLTKFQSDGSKPKHENDDNTDHYFHKVSQPSYATSFLMTAILSPDYQDKTGDGISDDDLGTGIKFNYSLLSNYQWRSPYQENSANINKCSSADPDDDKGSFVYGKKEICYLHSIKGKTQTAYFVTAEREDALGVASWQGGKSTGVKQRYLKEIWLFSNFDNTPVKVVHFDYDYLLCPNTPNSNGTSSEEGVTGGKLTLKRWSCRL